MKIKALIAFALLYALFLVAPITNAPAQQQLQAPACSSSKNWSTSQTFQLLPAGPGYQLCGYMFFASNAGSINLVFSPNAACASGNTALTPIITMTTGTAVVDHDSFATGLSVPPNNFVCAVMSPTMQGIIYYSAP